MIEIILCFIKIFKKGLHSSIIRIYTVSPIHDDKQNRSFNRQKELTSSQMCRNDEQPQDHSFILRQQQKKYIYIPI